MTLNFTRRTILSGIFFGTINYKLSSSCPTTPYQPKGPFFKATNLPNNIDLTNNGKAQGEIVKIEGKVIDNLCRPHSNCYIKIWQANKHGKYNHENDFSLNRKDKNFLGYSFIKTDNNGFYKFITIIPGSYKISKKIIRPPHIHLYLRTKDNKTLSTQLYFKGHKNNAQDFLYRRVKNKHLIEIETKKNNSDKYLSSNFNIVL